MAPIGDVSEEYLQHLSKQRHKPSAPGDDSFVPSAGQDINPMGLHNQLQLQNGHQLQL